MQLDGCIIGEHRGNATSSLRNDLFPGIAGGTGFYAPPYNQRAMLARVISILVAFLVLGCGLASPVQAFSSTAGHVHQPAGSSGSCLQQPCVRGSADGNPLTVQVSPADAESGAEQLDMHCFVKAGSPAAMAFTRLAPLSVRAPVAPVLGGLDRPPNASARAG
jgi:hypothetical protein